MHALREANEGNGSYYFFPSLLSPLVSEATILPHYKIPVTGSMLKLTPMITSRLKHDTRANGSLHNGGIYQEFHQTPRYSTYIEF